MFISIIVISSMIIISMTISIILVQDYCPLLSWLLLLVLSLLVLYQYVH